jgi:hypothetical protein
VFLFLLLNFLILQVQTMKQHGIKVSELGRIY